MDTRIASVVPLFVFAACHKTVASAPPPTVEVAEVLQSDIKIHRQWVATLEGFVNADIRPQVEGYVRKQAYRDGAYVQAGDVLFLIDPRNYQAALDHAKSTLARNIAALGKARLDVKRDRELIAGQFIPQQQLDNDVAPSSKRRRTSARPAPISPRRSSTTGGRRSPRLFRASQDCPAAGRQSRQHVHRHDDGVPGRPDQGGVQRQRARISDIGQGQSVGPASAGRRPGARVDPRGRQHLSAPRGRRRHQSAGRSAHRHDRRGGIVPNPGNLLRPGQYGKIRAAVDVRKGALLVPVRALNEIQGSYQVGVVDGDGKVDVRNVQCDNKSPMS